MSLARRTLVMGLIAIAGCCAMPAAAAAFGPNGGTEVGQGTAPANGALLTQTDAIPANATEGSFGVKAEAGGDPHAFDEITARWSRTFRRCRRFRSETRPGSRACCSPIYRSSTSPRTRHTRSKI